MLYRSAGCWAGGAVRLFAEQQPSPGIDAWDSLTFCLQPQIACEPLRVVTPREAAAALLPPEPRSKTYRKKYAVCSWFPSVPTVVVSPPQDNSPKTNGWRRRIHRPRNPPRPPRVERNVFPHLFTLTPDVPAEHGLQHINTVTPPARVFARTVARRRTSQAIKCRPESGGETRRRIRAYRTQFQFLDVVGIASTFNVHWVEETIEEKIRDAMSTDVFVRGEGSCWTKLAHTFGRHPSDDDWNRVTAREVAKHIAHQRDVERRVVMVRLTVMDDGDLHLDDAAIVLAAALPYHQKGRFLQGHLESKYPPTQGWLLPRDSIAMLDKHATRLVSSTRQVRVTRAVAEAPLAAEAAAEPVIVGAAVSTIAREGVYNYWRHALDKYNGGLPLGDNAPVHTLGDWARVAPLPPPGPLPPPDVPGRTPDNDEWLPSFPGEDDPYEIVPTLPGPYVPKPWDPLPPPIGHDPTPFPVPHPPPPSIPTPFPPGPLPTPQPDLPAPIPPHHAPVGHAPPIPIDVGAPQFEFPPLDITAPPWVAHYMQVLHDAGLTLAGAAHDIVTGASHVAPLVMPVMRLLQYYMQDYAQAHNNHRIYRGCDVGSAAQRYMDAYGESELHAAIRAVVEPGKDIVVGTDPYYLSLAHEQSQFGEGDAGARAIATRVMGDLGSAAVARANLPLLKVHQNTPRSAHLALARTWPEFRCLLVNSTHPHGAAQSNRTAMLGYASAAISRRFPGTKVRGIGLSPRQCCALPNLVHNCAPNLTGRDEYRHNHAYDAVANAAFRTISRDHKFEDCHSSGAPVALAVHSTGDIPLVTFAEECIKSGVHTAYVVMNIPVVMLDKRILRYTDTENGFVYQRDGDQLQMFFRGAASPGYVNSYASTISWCRPMPMIPGYHVQLEELKRFGTTFLFELRLSRGPQETLPTMFNTDDDDFMVLPMLRPGWRQEDGHRRDFAVPARRFRALVSFVSTIEPGKIVFQPVANKLRGQLGEVRIGKTVIENRWDLEVDEFYSVVGHAICANQLFARDYAETMPLLSANITRAYERHSRNPFVRGKRYLQDLFSFQLAKKAEIDATDGWDWLLDALSATHLDHGQLSNPYVSRRFYQIINDEAAHAPPSLVGGVINSAREAIEFGQYVFHANNTMFETAARLLRPYDPDLWLARVLKPREPSWRDIERADTEELELFLRILDPDHEVPTPPSTVASEEVPTELAPDDSVSVAGAPIVTRVGPPTPSPAVERAHSAESSAPAVERVHSAESSAAQGHDSPHAEPELFNLVARVAQSDASAQVPPTDPVSEAPPTSPAPSGVVAPLGSIGESSPMAAPLSVTSGSCSTHSSVSVEYSHGRARPTTAGNAPAVTDESGRIIGDPREIDVSDDQLAELHCDAPFEPDLPLYPAQASSYASQCFIRTAPNYEALEQTLRSGQFDIVAPDRGLIQLIQMAATLAPLQHAAHVPLSTAEIYRAADVIWRSGDEDAPDLNDLQKRIVDFFNDERFRGDLMRVPTLCLDGVAGSAKSSTIATWLRNSARQACIVVPSRNLRQQWKEKLHETLGCRVYTQHQLPDGHGYDFVIIDEAFTFSAFHLRAWCAYAYERKARVILLGDRYQRHPAEELYSVDHEIYNRRVVRMTTSNTVPLDAMLVFRQANGLGDEYTTRSRVYRSIRFYLPEDLKQIAAYAPGLNLCATNNYVGNLPGEVSIGQAQGLRALSVNFSAPYEGKAGDWVRAHVGARSVLFTRHSVALNVICHPNLVRELIFGLGDRPMAVVNGIRHHRLLGERQIYPFDLDLLPTFRQLGDQHVEIDAPGLPLVSSMRSGEHLTSFNSDYRPPVHDAPELMLRPTLTEVQGLIYERTNVDSVKDHEHAVNFNTAAAPGLHSVGEVSALVTRNDMRNRFDEAHKMADVQVSNSTFEDLRNILERQLQNNKSPHTSGGTWRDASAIFSRWCECFLRDEFCTVEGIDSFALRWITTRAPAFLKRLFDSPFSENSASVRFHAFLKQQTKFKATPGFAATVNYGQEIIANEAPYSALLAPGALAVYRGVSNCVREDFIPDIGLSDEELSEKMRRLGLLDRLYGCNMQIDVEKQDSSHSAEHVLAFCMLIEFLGFDPELAELYFEHCSAYAVVSQSEHLFKCTISFNLASGDPFTLIRNFFQMTSTLACRYNDTRFAQGVQKGDDLIVDRHLRSKHVLSLLPSIARVVFKEEFDTPPYHAGRFVHPLGLFVDPVRAMAKHLTRVTNENVPTAELHRSYVSRATVWPAPVQEYLRHVLPVHYPDFTPDQVEFTLRFAHHLRDWEFFRQTHDFVPVVKLTVESDTACAVTVAKAVLPGRDRQFYRKFLGLDADSLQALFAEHGIPSTRVDALSLANPTLTGVLIAPTHCLYRRSLAAQPARFLGGVSYGL